MGYISLYRQYRPQTFSDIIEQQAIIKTLQNAIKFGRIAHAYIFSGPRGTGKTSLARIFSKTVNCKNLDANNPEPCNKCDNCNSITSGQNMDVFEIDAASNTSVDNVRELIEKVNFLPALGKFKIYIIDETHMLSNSAFNALLKTLEEPPEHVIFILATTEPHKIPVTIQSRCQRMDFSKISQKSIVSYLENLSKKENIDITQDALKLIAKYSGGHMRDALSILDQIISFSQEKIDIEDVVSNMGSVESDDIVKIIIYALEKDYKNFFQLTDDLFFKGVDPIIFTADLLECFKSLILLKLKLRDLVVLPDSNIRDLQKLEPKFNQEKITDIIKQLSKAMQELKYMEESKVYIESIILSIFSEDSVQNIITSTLQKVPEKQKIIVQQVNTNSTSKLEDIKKHLEKGQRLEKIEAPVNISTEEERTKKVEELIQDQNANVVLDLVNVKHHWSSFVSLVRKQKMTLYAFLCEGMPYKVENNLVYVGFKEQYSFHCKKLQASENKVIIRDIAKKLFNKKIDFDFSINNDNNPHLEDSNLEQSYMLEQVPQKIKDIAAKFEGEIVV